MRLIEKRNATNRKAECDYSKLPLRVIALGLHSKPMIMLKNRKHYS